MQHHNGTRQQGLTQSALLHPAFYLHVFYVQLHSFLFSAAAAQAQSHVLDTVQAESQQQQQTMLPNPIYTFILDLYSESFKVAFGLLMSG